MLKIAGLTKRFGEVLAVDDVSMQVRPGEVHCVLGENGAGKSTLISMLAGMLQPDSGVIELAGRAIKLTAPADSLAQGIGVVYQHSTLIAGMTVIENLMLGQGGAFWLDRVTAMHRLQQINELLGVEIEPDTPVSRLGLGQRQQLEIAKALWRGSRLLILDEPTSMLTPLLIEQLLQSITRLSAEGISVIFVSHKLSEVLSIGDSFTVLRAGRVPLSMTSDELHGISEEQRAARLIEAMFGADAELNVPETLCRHERTPGQVLLSVEGVTTRGGLPDLQDISLQVRSGEVVGIAGMDGQGQRELARVVAGGQAITEGRVCVSGRDISSAKISERQQLGVRYVTDDRLGEGVVGSLSVASNLMLKRLGKRPFWRFGFAKRRTIADEAKRLIEQYEIRTPSPETRTANLSGGNVQKIVLARELSDDPRVVVFDKPAQGLDMKTVLYMREAIREFALSGGAALLISSELDEHLALADRIAVLSSGRIVGWVPNNGEHDQATLRERIGDLMAGAVRQ